MGASGSYFGARNHLLSAQQIFWECRQVQISEDGKFTAVEEAKYFAPSRAIQLIPEPGAEPPLKKYEFWYNIIEEFSGTEG
jgi:hypothetical protein